MMVRIADQGHTSSLTPPYPSPMRTVRLLVPAALAVLLPLAGPVQAQSPAPAEAAATSGAPEARTPAPLVVERGTERLPLLIPRDETLTYGARLQLGPVDARVGRVTLRSGVEVQRKSLLRPRSDSAAGKEQAWIEARAIGEYTVYSLDSVLESRYLPQDWPRLVHRMEQKGTEKRRREVLAGVKGGELTGTYRSDTSKGAPRGTRIWNDPVDLTMPEGVLDSVGAVYLVRTMVRDGLDRATFPMIDKNRLWQVEITLGDSQVIEVPAGRYAARPVLLATERTYREGEEENTDDEQFSGPFGIRGNIHLWVEERTGVPVRIQGTLPAGPLDIDLDIRLESSAGTPDSFAPVDASEPAE